MYAENPTVSVLMGVFNCEETVQASIQSIRNQSFSDWEMIVVDDGSTDSTLDLVTKEAARDDRIKVQSNARNFGLAYTLNRALAMASGTFVARQDGDDISKPERLEVQIRFLTQNPEYSFVSSAMSLFDDDGTWGLVAPKSNPTRVDFVSGSPFGHAPVVLRRDDLESVGGYRVLRRTTRVEDLDLWFRMYKTGFLGYNLQECLYEVRDNREALIRRRYRYRLNDTMIRLEGFVGLGTPFRHYPRAFRPLVIGLIPRRYYQAYRRKAYRFGRSEHG